jgi:hypothetical protein
MANKINLPVYKMTATEFVSSFKKKGLKKKFVFQCELLSIKENDAAFGLVGYAASKTLGKWKYSNPIRLTQVEGKSYQFSPPLIFGNNELVPKKTPVSGAVAKYNAGSIYRKLRALARSKKSLKEFELIFTPKISKNPHVYYEVTIGSSTEAANPSPPADPY